MDEFTWIPDYNSQGNTVATVAKIQFGDGYVQRQTKGLNTLVKSWNLTFNARADTEADDIIDFLEARYGVTAFTWTAPGQPQMKWTCENWSRVPVGFEVSNISCTFQQVYEP